MTSSKFKQLKLNILTSTQKIKIKLNKSKMSEANTDIDPSKIIYYMDDSQRVSLEGAINLSLGELDKLFRKEEILKFLYKY